MSINNALFSFCKWFLWCRLRRLNSPTPFSTCCWTQKFGKHFHDAHGRSDLLNESHFKIVRKCQGKFDCLVFEMLYIKKFKPNLNVQADSIRAKLFVTYDFRNYSHRLLFFLVFLCSFWLDNDLMIIWKRRRSKNVLNKKRRCCCNFLWSNTFLWSIILCYFIPVNELEKSNVVCFLIYYIWTSMSPCTIP